MDSTEAQALLKSGQDGVAEWNRARQTGAQSPLLFQIRADVYFDVNPLDLQGVDLGGCCLDGSNLDEADLTNAHLYQASLKEADLSRSRFKGAHLVRARLDGSNLGGAVFELTDIREASFQGAMLGLFSTGASFRRANAQRATFAGSELRACDFSYADLRETNFQDADLRDSRFDRADLSGANFQGANLTDTSFTGANMHGADFRGADLRGAILEEARLIRSRIEGANLAGCAVYGISAWDLSIDEHTVQRDLNIGRQGSAQITVDDLEVAQFMYLLMNNTRLRRVIDTITSKVVLILGRFDAQYKPVLDSLRNALRDGHYDFVPIVFDFDKPASRTTAETIATLAGMARFVIADLTEAKSVLQELREIVPGSPSLPIISLIKEGSSEPGMIDSFRRYPWFLPPHVYSSTEDLLASLREVLEPAIRMSDEFRNEDSGDQ